METETKMFQTSSHNTSAMLACVTSVSDRLRESWSEEEGFRFSLSRASCHSGAPRRHKFRAEAGVLFVNLWEGVKTENHLCCHKSLTPYRWNVTKSINHQAKPVVSNKSYVVKHWNCTKIFDHFKCSLRISIWGEYSTFFKPSAWNYLHLDWTNLYWNDQ